ncbi:hypothetical protein [Thauera humireducens]|uniref:hypothetical protein n=1 Tax=Thauera humireducens TaxID=1134435 RepID=UPI0031201877
MAEYNIEFAEKLITAARVVASSNSDSVDAQRTILYLSLLSCEISLKALLERAGFSVREITALSHNLRGLLDAVCRCEVNETIGGVIAPMWISAARVCAIPINVADGESTVGTLLSLEEAGASRYPNQIRYGSTIVHVPCEAMLQAAEKVVSWVIAHIATVRRIAQSDFRESGNATEPPPRRRDTRAAVTRLCSALGGGVRIGDELQFDRSEQAERGQDYWIGFTLVDHNHKRCGEVSAGYVAYSADIRCFASIVLDGEVIDSEAVGLTRISQHDRERNEHPRELKALLISIAERATRKANTRRGISDA